MHGVYLRNSNSARFSMGGLFYEVAGSRDFSILLETCFVNSLRSKQVGGKHGDVGSTDAFSCAEGYCKVRMMKMFLY